MNIIGIGPGDTGLLTQKARAAIDKSRVIVGYKTYIKLLGNLTAGKEIISSGMTREVERARLAIKKALEGDEVSLISGGDPGVYGMAGVVLELLNKKIESKIKIEIIPGVMALSSCASLLGAPLMHDFAVVSLSDLLTDIKDIERRIELAAKADYVIVLYNPKSLNRVAPIKRAWQILMKYRPQKTPVGIVRNADRDNEEVKLSTLEDMLSFKRIDMVTTIIVGNSKTYVKGRYMITPRGYKFDEK